MAPTLPSFKLTTRVRGTAFIGASNIGFVSFAPNAMLYSDPVAASTQWPVVWSDAAYAGTQTIAVQGSTNTDAAAANSPFTRADFGTSTEALQGRVVCSALRVRCIAPSLTRAGRQVGWADPDGRSAILVTFPELLANNAAQTCPADGRWHTIVGAPARDLGYLTKPNDITTHDMVFMFSGPTGQEYEFEAVCHSEIVGPIAVGKTPSYAAVTAATAVLGAVKANPSKAGPSFAKQIADAVVSTAEVIPEVARMAAASAQAFVSVQRVRATLAKPSANLQVEL